MKFDCLLAQSNLYEVSDYGAVPDSSIINTKAIQSAIDDCSKMGGGKVHFKQGKWLSGTLILKDNVTLSIDEGTVLQGSPQISDYSVIEPFNDGGGAKMGYFFVGAVGAKNIGIEGKGIIDGQGKLVRQSGGGGRRPFLLRLVRCEKVSVKDLQLINSTAWTFHLFQSKDVNVSNIKINSVGLNNNDGIDIDGSQDVSIKNCEIVSDDDAICFKATTSMGCKNVLIEGVSMNTKCGAIKFGTESMGDFENIKISNCHVIYANLGGIKLFSVDGAHLHNVDIENIRMDRVSIPIMLRLGGRLKVFKQGDTIHEVGTLSDVHIKNIMVGEATSTGLLISGIPGHNIEGVSIENVNVHLRGSGISNDVKLPIDEKITAYPDPSMFGKLPAFGMFMRHASDIAIKNVQMTILSKIDKRSAIVIQDVEKIRLNNWELPFTNSEMALISIDSSKGVTITGINESGGTSQTFLSVNGKESKDIKIDKSIMGEIKLSEGVSADVIKKL